jgi:membrane-associated phospholipid phosphatase
MPARRLPPRLVAIALLPLLSVAGGGAARAFGTDELTYDLRIDLPVTLGAGAVWLGSDLIGDRFAPDSCRWCASNPIDDGVRSALVWDNIRAPHELSNYLAYLVLPGIELGLLALAPAQEGRSGELGGNVVVVAESIAIAGVVTQLVKYTVARERPFVHQLAPDQKPLTADPKDNNLSFYSGHTSFAFALVSSAGSVAVLRGYRIAPAFWVAGGFFALGTAYLRIAADRHYFTDVVAGAAVGTAVGVGVPFLFHHQGGEHRLTLVPVATPQSTGLALAGVF